MCRKGFVMVVAVLFLASWLFGTAQAGFFDELKDKVTDTVKEKTDQKIEEKKQESGISKGTSTTTSSYDCKKIPCGIARLGSCLLCCDGKYMNPKYAEHMAHVDVDQKFKHPGKTKDAANGANDWIGAKYVKFVDKSKFGEHKYCWNPVHINDLPIMKSKGYLVGEWYDGKCYPSRSGTCLHPVMECHEVRSSNPYCNFELGQYNEKDGKCLLSESPRCPEMKK